MKAFYRTTITLCIFLAIVILTSGTAAALEPIGNTTELPTADFSYTTAGNTVHITDKSINTDYLEYDLGDGTTKLIEPGEEFTHVYPIQGTYSVTVTPEELCGVSPVVGVVLMVAITVFWVT